MGDTNLWNEFSAWKEEAEKVDKELKHIKSIPVYARKNDMGFIPPRLNKLESSLNSFEQRNPSEDQRTHIKLYWERFRDLSSQYWGILAEQRDQASAFSLESATTSDEMADGTRGYEQSVRTLTEGKLVRKEVRDRAARVQGLERDIKVVADLFQEFSHVVVGQEPDITKIENDSQRVGVDVQKAGEKLDVAIHHARSRNIWRRRSCIVAVMILLAIGVIITLVVLLNKK